MMTERWSSIPDINGFQASSLGRIRYTPTGYIMPLHTDNSGPTPHKVVFLAGEWRRAELLVMWAFVGKQQRRVVHKDGNTLNNTLENLRYQ